MSSLLSSPMVLLLLVGDVMAGETALCATKDDLLVKDRVTEVQRVPVDAFGLVPPGATLYRMAFESEPISREGHGKIRIRVWRKTWESWPGYQPQIIQILDRDDRVLNAMEVGDEPMMRDAWIGQYRHRRLFVYIECDHRRGDPRGTYVYEVGADNSIVEKGIYFAKKDLEVN